jgi:signal transduction histidine kinase
LKLYFLFFYLINLSLCFSQSDSTFYYFHPSISTVKVLEKIEELKSENDKNFYHLIYHSKIKNTDSMLYFLYKSKSDKVFFKNNKSRLLYFEGYYNKLLDNDSLFVKNSYLAFKEGVKSNDTLSTLNSLSALSQSYDYSNDYPYNLEYLKLYEKYASKYKNKTHQTIQLFLLGNYYLFRDNAKLASENYNQILNQNLQKKDSVYILSTYNSLGVLHETVTENSDSAIYYYNKKVEFMDKHPKYGGSNKYFDTYLNMGNSFTSINELKKAEFYYKKADSIITNGNKLFNKSLIKENLSLLYAKNKNYELAYQNLIAYNTLTDSLNKKEQRIAIADIKEQYDNQKLRADNLEIESKRKQNKNLLIGALVFILFGGITAFLIQKNTRKKQKLAEQEKALETQKLATVLKEQELKSIDAMIEGQEKERQRIANDLHDDLGGLMATVKLHFNVLKDKQTPELFDKTNNLLDEAYNKIRGIAHAKNSGVIAKQGLLKAVQNMADKISVSNKITVDVIDHGLENRLENSLELTIFRIIQELITNIIKHANATEAIIHLTNHEDTLNIMIEDNGKGFNVRQITTKNKGMGISSIDKRVEHLNGKMTIESERNKGTTIIIDIPT